ncbi:MAG: DsbA family protein [Halobacterium sp.]
MVTTRRAYLAGVAGAVGLAGCLGGGSSGANGCEIDDEPVVESLPSPVLGDPDADVTVMVFEDFACPHCATFSLEVLPRLRESYTDPGTIRYEHHDLPIPVDEKWSWKAASAARGVQDEVDDDAFFEFAHALFENQGDYSMSLVTDLANEAGAPGCAIQADAVNETYRPVVEADRQYAVELGADGTPAAYVNGESVDPTYGAIADAIDAAT